MHRSSAPPRLNGAGWTARASRPLCSRRVVCSTTTATPPAAPPANSTLGGKCPFSSNGTQGLLQAAAPASKDPQRHFSFDRFDYAPFSAPTYQGSYKMTMGLEPMNPADWIEIDEHYEEEIALRRELLATQHEVVVRKTPESEEADWEMLELLAHFLPKRFPDRFHLDGHHLHNHATGDVWDLSDKHQEPLDICSLLVQEDLCLMTVDKEGVLRFVSGAVLFPQRWSLIEKIGLDMARIHDPVPFFNTDVLKPVNAFMSKLTPPRPFWRANWTISDNPALFQPLVEEDIYAAMGGEIINDRVFGTGAGPVTAENAGERLQTRCERETLCRFPRTQAILFTIRTHQRKLNTFESRPDKAAELARALRNLPDDIVKYKTIAAFKGEALEYLDSIAVRAEKQAVMA